MGLVLRAVQMASAELGPEDVESLQDPQFRSQGASAVLAKLLNGLHAIKRSTVEGKGRAW